MKNEKFALLTKPPQIVPRLKEHIKKFGHRPEHHLYLFSYEIEAGYELIYFDFGDVGGIVAQKKGKRWYIIEEPITPSARRIDLFLRVLKYILISDSRVRGRLRVSVEDWTEEFKNKCTEAMRSLPYRILRPNTVQYCPVINLEKFDSALAGGHMKGLRYVKNHFSKNYGVEVKDAREAPSEEMLRLLKAWTKMRTAKDKVWASDYEKFIINGFPGCDIRRSIFIDGSLRGLSAGWGWREGYYIYMDIHDYSDEYLGEFVSLDHILEAKKMDFKYLDFGGSDKGLLNFKKKFHPEYIYKTLNFSIALK